MVLMAAPLTACSSDDPGKHSAISQATASSDSTLASAQGFILTHQHLERVKSDAGAVAKIRQASAELGAYTPHPVAELNLLDHYTSTGTDEELDQGSQDLARDANAAYVKALSYLVTGNTDDAGQAQRILDAWATTLQNVGTVQVTNAPNFNGPYLLAAATWVRGVGG
ncbi:alginate lyase family protein [Corynebacterium heidelbergense]|nr:Alginate lyase [Corynebacterium heidelbergense]